MRCGVPILSKRVAPRCTAADTLMVVTMAGGHAISRDLFPVEMTGLFDVLEVLGAHRIDTLICGGIGRDAKDAVLSLGIEIIDNVACSADEIVPALEDGALVPGFGLSDTGEPHRLPWTAARAPEGNGTQIESIDCIRCQERVCLDGKSCLASPPGRDASSQPASERMLETAYDIAQERERQLCRIAEMVYFCLDMDYRRIGIAFCAELQEPARILSGVLRRFFEVIPVCCKIGGAGKNGDTRMCNPLAQAEVLNRRRTDINLIVGLCVGSDSVFAKASDAPVSTLFVKDRSLANNPIGALYSDYYLRESVSPATTRDLTADRGIYARDQGRAANRQYSTVIKEES